MNHCFSAEGDPWGSRTRAPTSARPRAARFQRAWGAPDLDNLIRVCFLVRVIVVPRVIVVLLLLLTITTEIAC